MMSEAVPPTSIDAAATSEASVAPVANELRKANRKLTWQLTAFAMGSLAFGFALVPLYDVLCEVTGFGNRKTLLEASAAVASNTPSREVTVEFLATNPTVGEWDFKPVAGSMKVLTGQLVEAKFTVKNLLAQPTTGQAIPDIAPSYVTVTLQNGSSALRAALQRGRGTRICLALSGVHALPANWIASLWDIRCMA